ncbi:HTH CenpB-type DNA-binding domain [Trinorchestia longiramus]|nr:HTH CenpB-type DNA-binding domain [Trinorchestia longiramus]
MKPVFSDAQEKELLDYILVIQNMLEGLTTRDVRYLAYYMAEKSKTPHNFNKSTGLAGRDWLTRFKQRHPELVLYIPDVSLVSREKAINRGNVAKFVSLAERVLKIKNISTCHFSTGDEGSLNTIQKDDMFLCKHDIFGDVGIAVKMQLDKDTSGSSSSPIVEVKFTLPETDPTDDDEAPLQYKRHEKLYALTQDEAILPQLNTRIQPNTDVLPKQSDDNINSCMEHKYGQDHGNDGIIKSEVAESNACASYNPLPLVPVVFIKEELPDHDLRSVAIKEEPFSDALHEEEASSSSDVSYNTRAQVHGSPLSSSASEELFAARLKVGSVAEASSSEDTTRLVESSERRTGEAKPSSPLGEGCEKHSPASSHEVQHSSTELQLPSENVTAASSELSAPMLLEHSDVKNFQCTQCKFSTAYKGTLQRHIKVQHSTTKPYDCPLCEYSCADKRYLKTHTIARHSDVRPFKCSQCEYSSTTNTHLKQHIMVKHLGVKPFQCSQCKFSSGNKSNLERHTLVKHSNINPFHCPHCDYTSYDKSNFKRHFLSKHSGLSLPRELLLGSKK